MPSVRLALLLLLVLLGCNQAALGDNFASAPTAPGEDGELPRLTPPGVVEAGPAQSGDPIHVVVDPTQTWGCGAQPIFCLDDYIALARSIAPPGVDLDVCAAELPDQLRDLGDAQPPFDPWDADDLRDDLIVGLDLDWLLDGIDERPLELVLIDEQVTATVRERTYLVTDPIVGTMQWRFLGPVDDLGATSAVIALPGHPDTDDSAQEFLDLEDGSAYPEAGLLLAISSQRAYDGWFAESEANAYLLCAGSSLMAIRVYETLLMDRFIRSRGSENVSLVGHSGGSVALNALVRLDWRWRAAVSDLESNYATGWLCDDSPDSAWCLLDEVHPHLAQRFPQINNEGLVERRVPWLMLDYGYPDGAGPVLEFLAEVLGS